MSSIYIKHSNKRGTYTTVQEIDLYIFYKISVLRGQNNAEDSSSNRKHFLFYRHVELLNKTFEGNRN